MKFIETELTGAYRIELDSIVDSRGFFSRAFCVNEFSAHGISFSVKQANLSFTARRGTLRGLHYQLPPAAEAKFIRCIKGAIYDVIVDMRPDSPSYLQYYGVELNDDNRAALYIPEMFAHGYLTLSDNVEVFYQVSEFYAPGAERGLRYDDPSLRIAWPIVIQEVSDKDKSWPLIQR